MTQTVTDLVTLPNVSTFNSNTNRIKVRIDYLSCASKSDDVVQLYILNGATSTGGTFTPISLNQSVMEYSTNATYTGGNLILSQVAAPNSTVYEVISDLDIILAPGECLVFRGQNSVTASATVTASLSWVEYY